MYDILAQLWCKMFSFLWLFFLLEMKKNCSFMLHNFYYVIWTSSLIKMNDYFFYRLPHFEKHLLNKNIDQVVNSRLIRGTRFFFLFMCQQFNEYHLKMCLILLSVVWLKLIFLNKFFLIFYFFLWFSVKLCTYINPSLSHLCHIHGESL